MKFLVYKNKALISSVLLISSITAQPAQATSAFSSTATYDFTITATNSNTNSNSLSGLTIGSTINDFGEIFTPTLNYAPSFTSSSSTHTATLADYNSSGTTYTQIFHAEDNISNSMASSEYFGEYLQTFKNTSVNINDVYNITIDYTYNLLTNVSGQHADTDVNIAISTYNSLLDASDTASASIDGNYNNPSNHTGSFSFTLLNGEFDILFADTTITGSLEASPVPVPAAFWLFATAIMALPGIREFKIKG